MQLPPLDSLSSYYGQVNRRRANRRASGAILSKLERAIASFGRHFGLPRWQVGARDCVRPPRTSYARPPASDRLLAAVHFVAPPHSRGQFKLPSFSFSLRTVRRPFGSRSSLAAERDAQASACSCETGEQSKFLAARKAALLAACARETPFRIGDA